MSAGQIYFPSASKDSEADRWDVSSFCCLAPPPAAPPTSPTTVMQVGAPLSKPYSSEPPTTLQHRPSSTPRKSVAFSDEIWLYRSDKTEDEVQGSWYNREEISAFKGERRFVIQMLRAVDFRLELIDESTCCLRGYEAYFSVEYNRATKFVREAALRAVLSEQHRQRSMSMSTSTSTSTSTMGIDEPYRLSLVVVDHDESGRRPVTAQLVRGGGDPTEALRRACRETSEWAVRNAMELGANDAAFAHHLYKIEYFSCR